MSYELREDLVPDPLMQPALPASNYSTADLSEVCFEEQLPRLGDAGDFIHPARNGEEMSEIVRQIRTDLGRTMFVRLWTPVEPDDSGAPA